MSILDLRRKKKPKPPAPAPPPPTPTPADPPPIDVVPVGPPQPIRITTNSDGSVINRGYSYHSQAHVEPTGTILTFCGVVGKRPQFFRVELDGRITRLGALIPYDGESEGWYFNPDGTVSLCDGPRLRRVHPVSGTDDIVLDVSQSHPGSDIWQAHSSADGTVHSATVRRIVNDGKYPNIGTVVRGRGRSLFIGATGTLDESAITGDGEWLIIKETDPADDGTKDSLYNWIVRLADESRYQLPRTDRIGHSDCGPDYIVGADSNRGECIRFDPQTRERRKILDTWNLGSVSVRNGRCLRSSPTALSLLSLDGVNETPLLAHGMIGSGYDFQCHANLDATGKVAAWVSNAAGRFDLYLQKL